jgi:murein endopeptidase
MRAFNIKQTILGKLIFAFALLLTSCGPKGKSSLRPDAPATPQKQDIIYERPAQPTLNIPQTKPNEPSFESPASIIKTKDGKEVILGFTKLTNTKIRYSSVKGKMQIVGDVLIFDKQNNKLAQKSFSLVGYHKQNETIFGIYDENDSQTPELLVRAKANCIGLNRENEIDCNHVVIDLYFAHKGKFYSEQIEAHDKPAAQPPAPEPDQIDTDNSADPDETEDQKDLQSEGSDQSVNGRYQGTIGIVDLDKLFSTLALQEPPSSQPAPKPTPVEPSPVPQPKLKPVPVPQPDPRPAPQPRPIPQPMPKPDPKPAPAPEPPKPPKLAPPTVPNSPMPEPKPTPSAPQVDKILSPDLLQTREGLVRPYNQSLGFPDEGKLRNATSLITKQASLGNRAFFEVVAPDRKKHFATFEMAELVTRLGEHLNQQYTKKLYVANSSLERGGPVNPHASHQIGIDIDLAYPTDLPNIKFPLVVSMNPRKFYTHNYSTEKTYKAFKYLFSQADIVVDRVFVDQNIIDDLCSYAKKNSELEGPDKTLVKTLFQNLQHVKGHGDHYHVRIKCSTYDPGCRGRVYRQMPACN